MTDFVDRCREEWRRLRVPDPLADEMAADLTSDLVQAEAEGVSAEEFLGASASDPRAFAASWATERGVIPAPANPRRAPRALIAFTGLAGMALIVAVLLLFSGQPRVHVTTSGVRRVQLPAAPATLTLPPDLGQRVGTSAATPVEWVLLIVAIGALCFAAWLWAGWRRSRRPPATA
jgi:hypothetical protein